jgi:hypothetical protein
MTKEVIMKGFFFLLGFSQIAFQNGFWSEVRNQLPGLFAAVVVAAAVWFGNLMVKRFVLPFVRARSRYRITGIWIGTCKLPRYREGVEAVEIYRLVTKNEHVRFKFFNYLPNVNTVQKYKGAGIYRGMVLSAFYYIPVPQSSESGVFVLRKAGEEFKGIYAQYDLIADMKLHTSKEDFNLMRVRISFWRQMKMMLGLPPFPCYQQAKNLYDAVLREHPDLIPKRQSQVGMCIGV